MQIFFRLLLVLLLSVTTLHSTAFAQSAKAGASLRKKPTDTSEVAKLIEKETPLKLIGRKGFWVNVQVSGAEGWLSIKDIAAGKKTSSAINTGRQTKGNIIATSAARGLTAENLLTAKPDFDAFGALSNFRVSVVDGEKFASEGQLITRDLALLAGPAGLGQPKSAKGETAAKKKLGTKQANDDDDDDDDDEEQD